MLEISCGWSSGTELVEEQCCDLEDYPGDTPEDHTENPIHQSLTEIIDEVAKGDIPNLRSRDIALVTKHVNEVNKVLKCISVKNLSEIKYIARASVLLVCEKFRCQNRSHHKQKGTILEVENKEAYYNFEKGYK